MKCSWCHNEIEPFGRYLSIGSTILCEECVSDKMQEYDPEGDYIDMRTDEMIERRFGYDDD